MSVFDSRVAVALEKENIFRVSWIAQTFPEV